MLAPALRHAFSYQFRKMKSFACCWSNSGDLRCRRPVVICGRWLTTFCDRASGVICDSEASLVVEFWMTVVFVAESGARKYQVHGVEIYHELSVPEGVLLFYLDISTNLSRKAYRVRRCTIPQAFFVAATSGFFRRWANLYADIDGNSFKISFIHS